MSEILTESFCERCGTRYTFESARPKIRLKGVKVLSRGLKNFVLSDDTTMDEAMAAARSETDRESTAHQLDAFHKTFNFCMSCRQYTCPNCWNEVEARCQSCAPLPELEIAAPEVIPPEFPGLVSLAGAATVAEPAANGANGLVHDDAPAPSPDIVVEPAAKAADQTSGLLSRFRPGENLDDELAAFERQQSGLEVEAPAAMGEPIVEPEPPVETAGTMVVEAESVAMPEAIVEFESASEAEATVEPAAVADVGVGAKAGADALVEAATLAAEPDTVVAEPEPVAAEPVDVAPVIADPASPAADVVEQPTWRITAPDADAQPAGTPTGREVPAAPQPTTPLPAPDAQWPATPEWPARPEWPSSQPSAGLPFLGRPAQPQGGVESLWAASNRELATTPPPPGRTTSGIQPCISCGLSLSANARFCRRCGTLQGG